MPKFMFCSACGFLGGPYPDDMIWAGPGGQLSCRVCTHKRENKNIEVYGHVHLIEVGGWEPEIQRLQSLLEFYYKCPTVENIDEYLHEKDSLRGYKPPEAEVVRRRELILSLFDRIKKS